MTFKVTPTTNDLKRKGDGRWVSPGLRRYVSQPESASTEDDLPCPLIARVLILHAPLMLIFLRVPFLATIHSVVMLIVGLNYLANDKQPFRVAWIIAYFAGVELLWRGVEAAPVWEYSKYVTLILSALTLLKYRGKATLWPVVFVLLLVPGMLIMPNFNRQDFAFQLAGPFA